MIKDFRFEGTVKFKCNQKVYNASISSEGVKVFERYDRVPIVVYENDTGRTKWMLRHCCGAQGFGMGIDDTCHACEHGSGMALTEGNKHMLSVYGSYTTELADCVSSLVRNIKR